MRNSSRTMNLEVVRAALRDNRTWVGLGVVRLHPGETTHWEILDDGGILVDVELVPTGEPVACRLGGGGPAWRIPAPGTEVALAIPRGDIANDPMIVGIISDPPGALDEQTVVIVAPENGKVLIYDGTGEGEPVVKKSEFDVHTHPVSTTGSASAQTGTAAAPTAVTGTSVLLAK